MANDSFLRSMTDALGGAAITAADEIAPWLTDWRGIYHGQAQAVVRPTETAQVAECLRLCDEAGVPVVTRGGNTGLCGAATPDARGDNVILSLDRMNQVRNIDTIANTMTVEAGCILANLRDAAKAANRLFPLSLAAEGSSQIGGNLATNAGGVNVVRYGMARELVLGIEAVLPGGKIFNGLRTLRKDNTGYDLKQLLIGSEGTLGVITAAALRLLPRVDQRAVVIAAVESPQQALALFSLLYEKAGQRVQAFEFFTHECAELVRTHVPDVRLPFDAAYPNYVLVEFADTADGADEAALAALVENSIGEALERELCLDAAVSASLAQVEHMWRLREEISEAQRADGPHVKHDISLPIEALPEFMQTAQAALHAIEPALRLFVFGHFGDGNLHYNVSRPVGAPARYAAEHEHPITACVYAEVVRYGGSISAEHGIGQLKRDKFLEYKSPLEVELMRQIKHVFDPKGIMNPGKIF